MKTRVTKKKITVMHG